MENGSRLGPRQQGDLGELSAIVWLSEQGWKVYTPLGHSPDADLVADRGDDLIRVQVKTTTQWVKQRFSVSICTRGGNQSWSRVVKRFGAERCDYLFVHCGDGRRWFIPSAAVAAGTGIQLGGPKYAEYEIAPGRPLPSSNAFWSVPPAA